MGISVASYFQHVWDAAARTSEHYGVPNCRSLIIVQRQANRSSDYIVIDPRPIVRQVSQNTVKAYRNIQGIDLELDDLEMLISKSYRKEQIVGRGISYVVDAEMLGSEPNGGFEADKVAGTILRENDLTWELVIRRRAK